MPDTEIQAPAIFRGMLRDVVACGDYHEVCRMLGLVPAGPDVDQIEHYKSHMRIEEVNTVAPEVFAHADIAADLLYRLVRLNRDGDEPEDEDDPERAMFAVISRTAVATVVGHLLENGTLGVSR
ncbi:hypothetical protein DMB38_20095 [Streptomyces sp. WAC 06738]|uniref:hypothetical protein n=1 Tax=Streptomyces sp. WAC 06738 TaxID=2203210 RepID=UPI000F6D7878|nr:hypothetical protein [Streptomyces sp. WAC 06738]AZM47780.1 hypothetical protein DMB38_20095 [Streptomyces sp. WAC 06738]